MENKGPKEKYSHIQWLDLVMEYMVPHHGTERNNLKSDLKTKQDLDFDDNEFDRILKKLEDDRNVYTTVVEYKTLSGFLHVVTTYYLSFDGQLFFEAHGYNQRRIDEESAAALIREDREYNITRDTTLSRISRRLNRATWAIVFATLLLAFVEVAKSYHWLGLGE